MSRVLSTSVQIMGDATPREVNSKLGIRLSPVRMNTLDDRSRPNSFLLDGMEFRGWLSPFGTGFGLSLVDGDLPAEMGADHILNRLEEQGVEVEAFDIENPSERSRFERYVTNKLVGSSTQTSAPRKPGLKARLDAIQAQMPNDRFIKSLQDNLKRRGGLTQKQINAITKIENQLAGPKDQALIDRINAVLAKSPNGNSFLESLRDQVANGRTLSKKQLEALAENEKKPRFSQTRKRRKQRQESEQRLTRVQFHTMENEVQRRILAGGDVVEAYYGHPDYESDEARHKMFLLEVAGYEYYNMNTLSRTKAARLILSQLPKHPFLKDLPVELSQMILRTVIVDGRAWTDDLSQF